MVPPAVPLAAVVAVELLCTQTARKRPRLSLSIRKLARASNTQPLFFQRCKFLAVSYNISPFPSPPSADFASVRAPIVNAACRCRRSPSCPTMYDTSY